MGAIGTRVFFPESDGCHVTEDLGFTGSIVTEVHRDWVTLSQGNNLPMMRKTFL